MRSNINKIFQTLKTNFKMTKDKLRGKKTRADMEQLLIVEQVHAGAVSGSTHSFLYRKPTRNFLGVLDYISAIPPSEEDNNHAHQMLQALKKSRRWMFCISPETYLLDSFGSIWTHLDPLDP